MQSSEDEIEMLTMHWYKSHSYQSMTINTTQKTLLRQSVHNC